MAKLLGAVLEYVLFSLIGNLPLSVRQRLGIICGSLFSLVPTRERRVAALQLALCKIPGSHSKIITKMYQSITISLFESLNLTPLLQRKHVRCVGNVLPRLHSGDDQGVVALTAHTGNWDLQGAFFVQEGLPLYTIGREARSAITHRILEKLRSRYGIQTIWRSSAGSLKEIARVLQSKKVLATLIDQDTNVSSALIPFFGVPAKTPSSLIALARRWNCRIVTSFIFREKDGTYTIYTEDVPELSETDTLVVYHERLEKLLRQYPEQWVWFHKRWRSATGTTLGTAAYCEYLTHGSTK